MKNRVIVALFVCTLVLFATGLTDAKIHPSRPSQSDVFWGKLNQRFDMSRFNGTTPRLSSITRSEVMKRAQSWVDARIPYCQCNGPAECCGDCPHCGTYRCDCSGYVSYCWDLPYGYTTSTLPQVAHRITKAELKEGDVMLNVHEHVVIFGGWADRDNTTYHCFQEPGCHTSGPHYAFKSTVKYPFSEDPTLFKPYRYNHIVE